MQSFARDFLQFEICPRSKILDTDNRNLQYDEISRMKIMFFRMSKLKPITEFFARSCGGASSSSPANNEGNNENIAESATQYHFTFSSPLDFNERSPARITRGKPFHPGNSFKFPKTKFGSRERSCQSSWFESYKWLHYNQENDSVMCFICATEGKKGNLRSERTKEFAYISRGFRSWKKAP